MPQVFQVLKCYQCSIFQVHQTKKNNKWKCKVCDEKQSVKRHYGIGTGKDCRIHVQKLNSLCGNVDESKLSAADSEDSDYENNADKIDENKITQVPADSTQNQNKSKWLTYVDKEFSELKEPAHTDNIEICLEFPQKRKIKKTEKSKQFKVPRVSAEYCEKSEMNEISKKSPTHNGNDLNRTSTDDFTNFNYDNSVNHQPNNWNDDKIGVNKTLNFKSIGNSKWNKYVANDHDEKNDQHKGLGSDEDCNMVDKIRSDYYVKEENNLQHIKENPNKNLSNKPIFSLSDDNDLDSILDF